MELRELRAHLLAMGARCERAVRLAFDAFVQGTPEGAADVEALDVQIDRDELDLHALILRILALRQPVADDLRFLAAALRLITDLERIGDEAVNIGERAGSLVGGVCPLIRDRLSSMATAALEMLHLALTAFVQWDDAGADGILRRDEQVDRLYAEIVSTMTASMSERPGEIASGLLTIRVAKHLERIGDHATNLAEEVIFMIRGDDVRHVNERSASMRNGSP
jgi:phosphate transport system protein